MTKTKKTGNTGSFFRDHLNLNTINSMEQSVQEIMMGAQAINTKYRSILNAEKCLDKTYYGKHVLAAALGSAACARVYYRMMQSKEVGEALNNIVLSICQDDELMKELEKAGVQGAKELRAYAVKAQNISNNFRVSEQVRIKQLKALRKEFDVIRPNLIEGFGSRMFDNLCSVHGGIPANLKESAAILNKNLETYYWFSDLVMAGNIKEAQKVLRSATKHLHINGKSLSTQLLTDYEAADLEWAFENALKYDFPKGIKSPILSTRRIVNRTIGKMAPFLASLAICSEIFLPGDESMVQFKDDLVNLNAALTADTGLNYKNYSIEQKKELVEWAIQHADNEEDKNFFLKVKANSYDIVKTIKELGYDIPEVEKKVPDMVSLFLSEEMQTQFQFFAESVILTPIEKAKKNYERMIDDDLAATHGAVVQPIGAKKALVYAEQKGSQEIKEETPAQTGKLTQAISSVSSNDIDDLFSSRPQRLVDKSFMV